VANLFNLKTGLMFFDITSTCFELEKADGDGELHGYGDLRDRRADLNRAVIGLASTREGLPARRCVCPGTPRTLPPSRW
jgi:hypothetical protein